MIDRHSSDVSNLLKSYIGLYQP